MSIVDATGNRPRRRRLERGYTMLELTITMVVIVMMALVIERTLASTRESDIYFSAISRAKERCERAMYEVYATAGSSRRIFECDEVGCSVTVVGNGSHRRTIMPRRTPRGERVARRTRSLSLATQPQYRSPRRPYSGPPNAPGDQRPAEGWSDCLCWLGVATALPVQNCSDRRT